MTMTELKAIFIVAGHSETDPGAIGNATTERKEVKEIAEETIELLKSQKALKGISIYSVGLNESLSLTEKINKVNFISKQAGYDYKNSILISIHANSTGSGNATGVEGWHYGNCRDSKELATEITVAMKKHTGLSYRFVKSEFLNRYGQLGIIHRTKPLACLIECGFIDNIHDSRILKDPNKDDNFAKGIVEGIAKFLDISYVLDTPKEEYKTFNDVPQSAWYYDVVKKVNELGIMKGKDHLFHPAYPVNRAEMAKIISNLLDYLRK